MERDLLVEELYRLADLSAAIHRSAFGAEDWSRTLAEVSDLLQSKCSFVVGGALPGSPSLNFAFDGGETRADWAGYEAHKHIDPKNRFYGRLPPDTAFLDLELIEERERASSAFYQNLIYSNGMDHMIWSTISSAEFAFLMFGSLGETGRHVLAAREQSLVQLLTPHLRVAAEAKYLLGFDFIPLADLDTLVQALDCPAAIVTGGLKVEYANAEMAEAFDTGLLALTGHRLRLGGGAARRIKAALRAGATCGAYSHRLNIDEAVEAKLVFFPISRSRHSYYDFRDSELFLVVLRIGGKAPIGQAFLTQFNLTRREAEILRHICEGATLRAYADLNGISYDTVRWWFKRILEKTSCERQTELVALALSWRQGP